MEQVMGHLWSAYAVVDIDLGQAALFNHCRNYVGNDHLFYVLGLFLTHSVAFFGLNAFYGLLTWWKGPAIEQMRFQPGKHVSRELYRSCVLYVVGWHMIAPILPYFGFKYAKSYHPQMFDDPVPGIITILLQCIISYFVTDFLFYWGHRALHIGPLYRHIHKQHHKFYVSMGLAAEYAHPIELLFGNVLPVVAAPVFFKFHFAQFCIWNAIALLGTTMGHSGVSSPFSAEDGFHDFHHSNNSGNFGSMPHWDRICGTDKAWREYKAANGAEARRLQFNGTKDQSTEDDTVNESSSKAVTTPRKKKKQ